MCLRPTTRAPVAAQMRVFRSILGKFDPVPSHRTGSFFCQNNLFYMNNEKAQLSATPAINGDDALYVVLTKSLPNKKCVLNNYIGTRLEARNIGKDFIQVRLKKYVDWFSVPIYCVSFLSSAECAKR